MPAVDAIELAKHQLAASIYELESEAAGGRYNTFCIRSLANAAVILGQQDIAGRALHLLGAAPDDAFWAGAITNFDLPKTVPARLRTTEPSDELAKQHPAYCEETIVGRIRSYANHEEHFALCLSGEIQKARSKAKGLQLQEVGATLAVLGDFDSALSVARDPALELFRQHGVLLVLVVEFFRRARFADANKILAELQAVGLGASDRVILALGLAGREPWGGYPYPDW